MDEDPEKLHEDAVAAFEKYLLARLELDFAINCDVAGPEQCTREAEWWGVCKNCNLPFFWCSPHHDSQSIAAATFGVTIRCSGCGSFGPLPLVFTLGLLRSPA